MSETSPTKVGRDSQSARQWSGAAGKRTWRDWLELLAGGRRGTAGMFFAAILESSIIPFPVEVFLVPAILWKRRRAWIFATAVLSGSIVGSIAFYAVGWYLYDVVGQDLADFLGIAQAIETFEHDMAHDGFWLVFSISFFPLPLQVATLGSGAVGYDFGSFLAAIVLSRALRFYGLTALVLLFGEPVLHFIVHLSPVLKVVAALASLAIVVGLYFLL